MFLALAVQLVPVILSAIESATRAKKDLADKRVNRKEILDIVSDMLEAGAVFSPLVQNHRTEVLQFAGQLVDVTVEGINLLGGTGERIEFDPTPITPEGGAQ